MRVNGAQRTTWGLVAMLLIATATLVGCAAGGAVAEGGEAHPTPLEVELNVSTQDGRRMAYQLRPDGTLRFAGGRQVAARDFRESGSLSIEQRQQVWQVIERNELLDAGGRLFATPDTVRYQVELRAGRRLNSFIAVDDEVPGLAELHDALEQLHRDLADREIFQAIDGAIRRREGNVPRR